MTLSTDSADSQRGLALVLVVTLNLAAFAFLGLGILPRLHSDLGRWVTEGGPWMYAVVVLGFAQLAAALLLGILHQRRSLPLVAYLVLPAAAALVGILGAFLGGERAASAIAAAAPDQQLAMWAASLAIVEPPRELGFLLAAIGAFSALVGCSLAAYSRRAPGEGRGAALVAAGALALGTIAALVLTWGDSEAVSVNPSVLFAVPLALSVPLFGMAATGVWRSARSDAGLDQSQAVGWALACAACALLGILSLGAAVRGATTATVLNAFAHFGGRAELEMMWLAERTRTILPTVTFTFVGATALASLGLVATARSAFREGLRRRLLWGGLAGLAVGAVVTGSTLVDARQRDTHATVVSGLKSMVPDGVELAESSARQVPGGDRVVSVAGDEVLLEGKPIGQTFEDPTLERLGRAFARKPREPGNPRLARMLEMMREEAVGPSSYPGNWIPFHLVLDARTSGADVNHLVDWLGRGGARGVRLVVSKARAGAAAPSLEPEASFDLVRDIAMRSGGSKESIINVSIQELPSAQVPLLLLDGERMRLRGMTESLDPDAFREELEKLKERFPDATRIDIVVAGASSFQQIVAALDLTRENPGGRMLFPDVVLVGSVDP